jgi:hypothetical protein
MVSGMAVPALAMAGRCQIVTIRCQRRRLKAMATGRGRRHCSPASSRACGPRHHHRIVQPSFDSWADDQRPPRSTSMCESRVPSSEAQTHIKVEGPHMTLPERTPSYARMSRAGRMNFWNRIHAEKPHTIAAASRSRSGFESETTAPTSPLLSAKTGAFS